MLNLLFIMLLVSISYPGQVKISLYRVWPFLIEFCHVKCAVQIINDNIKLII